MSRYSGKLRLALFDRLASDYRKELKQEKKLVRHNDVAGSITESTRHVNADDEQPVVSHKLRNQYPSMPG